MTTHYHTVVKKEVVMKRAELIKILKSYGCKYIRDGSNHEIWINSTGKKFPVWRHESKDIPTTTVNKIFKQAGIKEVMRK